MVLVSHWGAKERHNAVTHDLVDGALIAMHRRHHAFEHGVEELPGLFGITVGQEFHGVLQIGKEHGHLLPFTFQGTAGGEDFLALWYSPGCKILVLSTAYVNISTFQYPEKRVQWCARLLRSYSTSPM